MAEYISRDDLLNVINANVAEAHNERCSQLLEAILNAPTADVVEVKHGEWFLLDECSNEGVYCSECHKKVYRKEYTNQKVKSKFCPNCGAKMDGGDLA